MTFKPSPQQALLLWTMITAETLEGREPLQSKTQPELKAPERQELVKAGLVALEQRPRGAKALVLTDRAWAWAANAVDIELMESKFGSVALRGLLRRLLPYLQRNDLPLAAIFATNTEAPRPPPALPLVTAPLATQIESACLSLADGARKTRVRLSALRRVLSAVDRNTLDHALLTLQDKGRLHLYREDNSAALTEDDHSAAILVGDAPRHLVLLEA